MVIERGFDGLGVLLIEAMVWVTWSLTTNFASCVEANLFSADSRWDLDKLQAQSLESITAGPLVSQKREAYQAARRAGDSDKLKLRRR